ncbi:MAG TPA: hypothetical protein VM513_10445 [Kofleriaceae bacterium]|nr:hypothetical protein [Kofleriaceae bacterium]
MTYDQLRGWFAAGALEANVPTGYTGRLVVRTRSCNGSTGCTAWQVGASSNLFRKVSAFPSFESTFDRAIPASGIAVTARASLQNGARQFTLDAHTTFWTRYGTREDPIHTTCSLTRKASDTGASPITPYDCAQRSVGNTPIELVGNTSPLGAPAEVALGAHCARIVYHANEGADRELVYVARY